MYYSREVEPSGGEGARDTLFRRADALERDVDGHLRAAEAPLVPGELFDGRVP